MSLASLDPANPPLPRTMPPNHAPITIHATPGTTIWRKPSGHLNVFNAPHRLGPPRPLVTFSRARVTISGKWVARHDNAGLLLVLGDAPWHHPNTPLSPLSPRSPTARTAQAQLMHQHASAKPPRRWVCAAVGVSKDRSVDTAHPMVSSCEGVATDVSMHPVDAEDEADAGREGLTVEVRVERDVVGASLYVYYLACDAGGAVKERHLMRELTWMFEPGWDAEGGGVTVQVGVYAAMPAFGESVMGKELKAVFRKLRVEWEDEDEDEGDE